VEVEAAQAQGEATAAPDNRRMDVKAAGEKMEWWMYRIGGFILLNVIDDPAWLALIFC
jgi:hypothetical protein